MKTQRMRKTLAAALTGLCASLATAQENTPQPGGTLNIGTLFITVAPLSFDNADWAWKFNHDMGLVNEALFAADLSKSRQHGGPYNFTIDAYLPSAGIRGELAESWQVLKDPWRIEVKLRQGIMFPAKKGVMDQREMTADDVVYSFNRYNDSAKRIPNYYDHVEKVEATGSHTVLFTLKHFQAEWDYRFGWGYYGAIVPREVVDKGMKNWRNANGTGPYSLRNYVQGNTLTFDKNRQYWDSIELDGKKYRLPFADTINYRIIRDESTALTALRTGKLDLLEAVRWSAVEELKKNAPQLQWNRYLSTSNNMLALRLDTKPFDDIRVRRALNMAIDRQHIIDSFFGGNAVMLAYPMHPDYGQYHEPLEDMPQEVQELFRYNPQKAKELLREAGYPDGFRFSAQVTSINTTGMDMMPLVAAQLEKIGVIMDIDVLEYPAFLSAMTSKKNAPGYFMSMAGTNPTTVLRKSFVTGQTWNPSQYADRDFDARIDAMLAEPDESKRVQALRAMTREILAAAPHVWLPTPYAYSAWWPWVKNYGGELRAGAERPGPIHARIWVDQEMKKKMGF